jgi:protein TonB
MQSSLTSTIIGWSLSICIYLLVVLLGIFMLQSHNTKTIKYTASKKNLLNVTLVERKEKKTVQKKKKKIVKKKKTVNKPKPKKETVRTKNIDTKPDFKKLFGKIDLDKLPKESQKREKKIRKKVVKKEIEEVVKDDKAKKITKALEFEKQESLIITQKDGVYDEFRGKIADILDSHWQVTIGVDKLGNFSYKIETLSYNDAFNAKLRDFLEEMRDIEFPAFVGGEIFNMKVVFKDLLE